MLDENRKIEILNEFELNKDFSNLLDIYDNINGHKLLKHYTAITSLYENRSWKDVKIEIKTIILNYRMSYIDKVLIMIKTDKSNYLYILRDKTIFKWIEKNNPVFINDETKNDELIKSLLDIGISDEGFEIIEMLFSDVVINVYRNY